MKDYICPMDELVTTDLEGYLEAGDGEEELFRLDGEKEVPDGGDQ